MEFRLSHEEALKKLNERYPPDADAPTIQDGALTIAEAVDTLLLSANEPMSRSELMDGLAAAWERGQLRNEPNDNSLRAILSRDADKRGWIKVGQGQNVNYKHRDQPKEIDPSDFGIDSGQASSNSGDIP
ncbi:MAG: hypothetical protein IPH13_20890 [Planctomycetes bacterium]|nr:hypothetical protein [Planctomycetota bacterium]